MSFAKKFGPIKGAGTLDRIYQRLILGKANVFTHKRIAHTTVAGKWRISTAYVDARFETMVFALDQKRIVASHSESSDATWREETGNPIDRYWWNTLREAKKGHRLVVDCYRAKLHRGIKL